LPSTNIDLDRRNKINKKLSKKIEWTNINMQTCWDMCMHAHINMCAHVHDQSLKAHSPCCPTTVLEILA
jgi:hypothetical protein